MMEYLLDPVVAALCAAGAATLAAVVAAVGLLVFARRFRLDAATMAQAIVHEATIIEQAQLAALEERKRALDRNPFYKLGAGFNLTEQSALLADDYPRAQQLAEEAGVVIPDGPCSRVHVQNTLGDPAEHVSDEAPRRDNVDPSYWGKKRPAGVRTRRGTRGA